MTGTKKLWIYRVLAVGLVGLGTYEVLTDLPPHTGFFPGLQFELGLYIILLPGAANLLNSFFGGRFFLLRWGVVVVNAGMTAFWLKLFKDFGPSWGPGLFTAAVGVLTLLSFLMARSWGKASKEVKATE